jgi:hypothetical protein
MVMAQTKINALYSFNLFMQGQTTILSPLLSILGKD